MIAVPGLGLGHPGAANDRPNALAGNTSRPRPVRDAVQTASDTVRKVVKRITDAATNAGGSAKAGTAAGSANPGAGSDD
jgi:hypothetical protein